MGLAMKKELKFQINWMKRFAFFLLLFFSVFLNGCTFDVSGNSAQNHPIEIASYDQNADTAYITLNDNQPEFTKKQKKKTKAFEKYSRLDDLGRCGVAFANICRELMPKEKRGEIGSVRPTGWHTVKYNQVDGKYLYNRCHLIGYQLAGENANERNLITGTRYMNVEGMLPFENEVADYVEKTGNHVLYRVTPVFDGKNLLADGVQMEAFSVEDQGKGICFNIFAYNIQPGIKIDYATGDSKLSDASKKKKASEKTYHYVINKNTKKFHDPSCSSVKETLPKNRKKYYGSRKDLIQKGYTPCEKCNP